MISNLIENAHKEAQTSAKPFITIGKGVKIMGKMMIDLDTFAGGSLAVKLNEELQNIIDNIADPNTEAALRRQRYES